jgi:hypothetical protein
LAAAHKQLPTSSPASSRSSSRAKSAANKADDEQQYQRANCGVDDCRNETGAKMNSKSGKQRTPDESACYSDDEIADDPEPGALHNLACKPAREEPDKQDHKEAFVGHVHC